MNYTDPRWQKKRLEILNRDNWQCVACGDGTNTLHVHHADYHGELWDTPDDMLQTLCEKCHSSLGAHPVGGPHFTLAENWNEGEAPVLSLAFHHCPICGNSNDASHSGCVIFECGHDFFNPEKWTWEGQQTINGEPAYYGIAPNA